MSKQLITREYNGNVFTFREDGYFNMTDAAKKFGKDLSNFMRSPETVEYVEALTQTVKSTDCPIVQAFRGGRTPGTWGHPKLAVFFARWLDVKFAVFCDMVIDDILNKNAELTITQPAESMAMKVPQSFPEALRLAAELAEKNERLALENQEMAPKAVVFDNCVALRQESLATFVRTLEGVNTMAIITDHRIQSTASKSIASTTGANTSGLKSFPYRLNVIPPLWWPRMPPTSDSTMPFCFR